MPSNVTMQRRSPKASVFLLLAASVLAYASTAYSTDAPTTPPSHPVPHPVRAETSAEPSLLELPSPDIPPKALPPATTTPEASNPPVNAPANAPAIPEPATSLPPAVAVTPVTGAIPLPATPAPMPSPDAVAPPTNSLPPHSLDKMNTPMKALENVDTTPRIMEIVGPVKLRLLEEPLHIPADFSLLFSKKDMNTIILPSLKLFDQSLQEQKLGGKASTGDNLTDLLESLQVTSKKVVLPLPHLYLGSIVYYSPTNWSVWINGKKLVNRLNKPSNILFVSNIDRTEAVLVWKPESLQDLGITWREKIDSKAGAPKNVIVDEAKGTITVTLHPNQTFVPKSLTVSEGLIKQIIPVTQDAQAAASGAASGQAPVNSPPPPPANNMIRKPLHAQ